MINNNFDINQIASVKTYLNEHHIRSAMSEMIINGWVNFILLRQPRYYIDSNWFCNMIIKSFKWSNNTFVICDDDHREMFSIENINLQYNNFLKQFKKQSTI